MASIENRSRFVVTVQNDPNLNKTFLHNQKKDAQAYVKHLKEGGHTLELARENNSYAVRAREVGYPPQCIIASNEQEAIDIKQRLESERRWGFFVDYTKGRSVTFADLMARYLREEAPRHKGFQVESYTINAILENAGLPRVDAAQAFADHTSPHPSLVGRTFPESSGKSVRTPSPTSRFVRKAFADVVPGDFTAYIDNRCQSVKPSTVDREIDVFSAICNIAIDTWRIPIAKSPMDGVKRPRYFNERDRRLKEGEEQRLLDAAYNEDAQQSIERRLEGLMQAERAASIEAPTTYRRKAIIKAARKRYLAAAETSYTHIPWWEAFVQFQLMTGARRSETLALTRKNINFEEQTAYIPESKNGRPRTLALRADLIALLKQLPSDGELLFPMSVDALRKAWSRICTAAELVGDAELHVHDLRHEAISRVADAGSRLPGGISLVDLQAFSGHRDMRMLLRYTHLCMPAFAKKLDEAFADASQVTVHRGKRRLKKGAQLNMKLLTDASSTSALEPEVQQTSPRATSNVVLFRRSKAA
jgi:integrase